MKTIKLIILGLLLSSSIYGQSDTIIKMVNGKNQAEFDSTSTYIISQTNLSQKGYYEDIKINTNKSQVLLLHLYDSCRNCDTTITNREVIYIDRITKEEYAAIVSSSRNVYYIDGNLISQVIVKKPE